MQMLKENLLRQMERLHKRQELSKTIGSDYFEPGMMEYLDQSDGTFDEVSKVMTLRFEAKGTRYDGRTELIEKVVVGDPIVLKRDPENVFNSNNFVLLTKRGQDVGNMPAELCNAIAPLYDAGALTIVGADVSFVDPISKRNRHARQAILFVRLQLQM
jgi:hypothetical protein